MKPFLIFLAIASLVLVSCDKIRESDAVQVSEDIKDTAATKVSEATGGAVDADTAKAGISKIEEAVTKPKAAEAQPVKPETPSAPAAIPDLPEATPPVLPFKIETAPEE